MNKKNYIFYIIFIFTTITFSIPDFSGDINYRVMFSNNSKEENLDYNMSVKDEKWILKFNNNYANLNIYQKYKKFIFKEFVEVKPDLNEKIAGAEIKYSNKMTVELKEGSFDRDFRSRVEFKKVSSVLSYNFQKEINASSIKLYLNEKITKDISFNQDFSTNFINKDYKNENNSYATSLKIYFFDIYYRKSQIQNTVGEKISYYYKKINTRFMIENINDLNTNDNRQNLVISTSVKDFRFGYNYYGKGSIYKTIDYRLNKYNNMSLRVYLDYYEFYYGYNFKKFSINNTIKYTIKEKKTEDYLSFSYKKIFKKYYNFSFSGSYNTNSSFLLTTGTGISF